MTRLWRNSATPPAQTVVLATNAVCPVEGDLEHPDPNNDDVYTFTAPTQMKTLLECILPEALAWMAWEYGGTLDIPVEWAGSQATSLMPYGFIYVPSGVRVTGGWRGDTNDRGDRVAHGLPRLRQVRSRRQDLCARADPR